MVSNKEITIMIEDKSPGDHLSRCHLMEQNFQGTCPILHQMSLQCCRSRHQCKDSHVVHSRKNPLLLIKRFKKYF